MKKCLQQKKGSCGDNYPSLKFDLIDIEHDYHANQMFHG